MLRSNQFLHLSGPWSNNYVVHQIILMWLSADAPCVSRSGGWLLHALQRKSHLQQILVELVWSVWSFLFFPTVVHQSIPLAHSTLLDSFKNFQNAWSSTPLSNLCDEFHHFEHNCQDVKLYVLLRKHEMFGFLLEVEEDTVFLVRYLGSVNNSSRITLNPITWHTASLRAYLNSTKTKNFENYLRPISVKVWMSMAKPYCNSEAKLFFTFFHKKVSMETEKYRTKLVINFFLMIAKYFKIMYKSRTSEWITEYLQLKLQADNGVKQTLLEENSSSLKSI